MKWFLLLVPLAACAAVFGSLRGVVHDPQHRPVQGAHVLIHASNSAYSQEFTTGADGSFESTAVPVGAYQITVTDAGLTPATQSVVVGSGAMPVLHFVLALPTRNEQVTVSESAATLETGHITPSTIVTRAQITGTPGADLTNSLNAITDYVPGSYVVHDQLHVRGGHQATWAIDGVPIPNTNIASNVGPQIDPKDIDYLEVQRGGYSADYGDRTYGVFNVVPRTGFERNNEGELFATYGSFHQTNDELNFGNHTEKFAYFFSINGNRSYYGLETPGPLILHDRVWGLGGMATLIYNRDANNQLRFTASLRRDDYQIPNHSRPDSADDAEREHDALAELSWARVFRPGLLLTVSPFFHDNRANYDGSPADVPLSATQRRGSLYGGAQVAFSATSSRHEATAGIYTFAQADEEFVRLLANDGSGLSLEERQSPAGNLEAGFLEDQYRPFSWLTLSGGVRLTRFEGAVTEEAVSPRTGASLRIPKLGWVLRGFWGKYYQAPPLSTVTGPLLDFAVRQGLGFTPLRGERDQEHQFGLTIPWHGWALEVNDYHQRARNYFDHNAIGNSNVFFPLTIQGARLYGWEVTARSPRIARRGDAYLSYAYAHAEGSGAISGGLTGFLPPASGYFLLDHDQTQTLTAGFHWSLPRGIAMSGNLYYGSGFTNGAVDYPGHLAGHTTFDLSLGKNWGNTLNLAVTALNVANRRFLLDNSLTFGGTHYAEPRQVYVQLRYRFRL